MAGKCPHCEKMLSSVNLKNISVNGSRSWHGGRVCLPLVLNGFERRDRPFGCAVGYNRYASKRSGAFDTDDPSADSKSWGGTIA